jgi:hypothetical protein
MGYYLLATYPTGKPKTPKKMTPIQENVLVLTKEAEKLKPLAAKVLRAYPDPLVAMKFVSDVFEEANFHRESRILSSTFPVGDLPPSGWGSLDPWDVASGLHFGDLGVFSFAIAVASALGLKAGARKILRTWASEMAKG